jgi:hypothetical protein
MSLDEWKRAENVRRFDSSAQPRMSRSSTPSGAVAPCPRLDPSSFTHGVTGDHPNRVSSPSGPVWAATLPRGSLYSSYRTLWCSSQAALATAGRIDNIWQCPAGRDVTNAALQSLHRSESRAANRAIMPCFGGDSPGENGGNCVDLRARLCLYAGARCVEARRISAHELCCCWALLTLGMYAGRRRYRIRGRGVPTAPAGAQLARRRRVSGRSRRRLAACSGRRRTPAAASRVVPTQVSFGGLHVRESIPQLATCHRSRHVR